MQPVIAFLVNMPLYLPLQAKYRQRLCLLPREASLVKLYTRHLQRPGTSGTPCDIDNSSTRDRSRYSYFSLRGCCSYRQIPPQPRCPETSSPWLPIIVNDVTRLRNPDLRMTSGTLRQVSQQACIQVSCCWRASAVCQSYGLCLRRLLCSFCSQKTLHFETH
jgi:hypothetical protein